MSLSDSLVYAPKPSAVYGHKYRQTLPTYNKATFLPGDTTMLNIPCGRKGQFLNQRMSYLNFKLNNLCQLTTAEAATNPVVAVAPICTDSSGSSLFARLDLYHGSTYWIRFTNIMCYMVYGVTCRDLRRLTKAPVMFWRAYMLQPSEPVHHLIVVVANTCVLLC